MAAAHLPGLVHAANELFDQGAAVGVDSNVPNDVAVALHSQSPEQDADRDFVLHVVHVGVDVLAELVAAVRELDGRGLGDAEAALGHRPDLGNVRVGGCLVVHEDKDLVLGDAVLRDDDLLVAVDDEIAAVVVAALVVRHGHRLLVQVAVARAHHHGDATEAHRRQAARLLLVLLRLGVEQHPGRDRHVRQELRGVGHVAQARVVGHHDLLLAVFLGYGGPRQRGVLYGDGDAVLVALLVGQIALVDVNGVEAGNDLLKLVHDKVVKGVDLVAHDDVVLADVTLYQLLGDLSQHPRIQRCTPRPCSSSCSSF